MPTLQDKIRGEKKRAFIWLDPVTRPGFPALLVYVPAIPYTKLVSALFAKYWLEGIAPRSYTSSEFNQAKDLSSSLGKSLMMAPIGPYLVH